MISYGGTKNNSLAGHHFLDDRVTFSRGYREMRRASRRKGVSIRVAIGPLAIGGNDPIYDLPLIELKRDGEVYITFPENVTLTVGEVFRIVRPFGNLEERYLSLGRPRITVAKVKILKVHRGRRAEIKVLRGSIIGGVSAERD